MARLTRLLRAMPELMILIKGIVSSLRSVFFCLFLLTLLLFLFGIALRQLMANSQLGETHFTSVHAAIYFVLVSSTFTVDLGIEAQAFCRGRFQRHFDLARLVDIRLR